MHDGEVQQNSLTMCVLSEYSYAKIMARVCIKYALISLVM